MFEPEIFLHCVRLILGGLCAFAAILLCSKKRSAASLCLLAFVLTFYASEVYKILRSLGIVLERQAELFGIPALDLAFDARPPLFLFLAIIFMLSKKR